MSTKEQSIELAKAAATTLIPVIKTKRDLLVDKALSQVGTTEEPGGKNRIKYNTEFYGRAVYDGDKQGHKYPWCCTFIAWCFNEIGYKWPVVDFRMGWASVPSLYEWAKNRNMLTENPKPGDLIIYAWDGGIKHIGLYLKTDPKTGKVEAVEGNTSFDNEGSQDNGDGVAIKHRNKNIIKAYVNVDKFLGQ